MVLLSAPFLGAVMDYAGSKKKFLFASCLLTVLATAALYFVRPGDVILGMLLIVLSNVGFSYSESFVSSFLPGLGPPRTWGKFRAMPGVWAISAASPRRPLLFLALAQVFTRWKISHVSKWWVRQQPCFS